MSLQSLPQQEADPSTTFDVPASPDAADRAVLSTNIARLEYDLDKEREERREERFLWISVTAFLLDIVAYRGIESFWGFLLLFMFQLIVLAGIARRLGVDWAVQGFGWLLYWISENLKSTEKPDND